VVEVSWASRFATHAVFKSHFHTRLLVATILATVVAACTTTLVDTPSGVLDARDRSLALVYRVVYDYLADRPTHPEPGLSTRTRVDTIIINRGAARIDIRLSHHAALMPFRPDNTAEIYRAIRGRLGKKYRAYELRVSTLDVRIEDLIPNLYRLPQAVDGSRLPMPVDRDPPVVTNLDRPVPFSRGLADRHIALWGSHGWYYDRELDRWQWQRSRQFGTVEDLLPTAIILQHLAPMLENAGANVFLPRERDTQTNEAVVDNDGSGAAGGRYDEEGPHNALVWRKALPGFAFGTPPYSSGRNPFLDGSYSFATAESIATAHIRWTPEIPETGNYAVYVSYRHAPDNAPDARYVVHHAGGKTRFSVNQRMGGSTWIYLGTFRFRSGATADSASVVLSNQSAWPGSRITADAVRFGGGMGSIERNGQTSGRPRFVEAARYYMQYAGMPDTLVYNLHDDEDDYRDDYRGRGEWVNYLRGGPFGPNRDRGVSGLAVPVDLSLAFHTDAGVTQTDSTIGTLAIYSLEDADSVRVFPDGRSRFANRDLADLIQTQLVADIRERYNPKWTRRSLYNADYGEALRPNVPSVLLELLSHMNFADMQYALDPEFRFDVSRAIYKGILRFLWSGVGEEPVVQPLPVTHFRAELVGDDGVRLSWRPRLDSLEASAVPTRYVVYTRVGSAGFDNGRGVYDTQLTIEGLQPGTLYSFKVEAANEGGTSFPSETLAVGRAPGARGTVLTVNGFDRVSAPAAIDADSIRGFFYPSDRGVAFGEDLGFTGDQYEFNVSASWRHDEAPGLGASYADFESVVVGGNTFDYPAIHGASILAAGYSFESASDESLEEHPPRAVSYTAVNLILGEERRTRAPGPVLRIRFEAFPEKLQSALRDYTGQGGSLLVSGAYVGTDLSEGRGDEHPDVRFGREVLGVTWRTDHAARTGRVHWVDPEFGDWMSGLEFRTNLERRGYAVESPDGLVPAGRSGRTIMRYSENNVSAGVALSAGHRAVTLGFPIETILDARKRDELFASVLAFFSGEREEID
jgi:hypothetical protein